MQPNPTRDMMVGAAAMAVLAGLFAFSYAGKDLTAQASVGTYPVKATFNRVDGLFEGDEVRLGGIKIGTVGKQTLDAHYRATVILNLNTGMEIPNDSAAAIHTDGLFGSKFVVIEPGIDDVPLKSGDVIDYTQGSVVVGELLNLIIEEGRARQQQQKQQQQEQPQAAEDALPAEEAPVNPNAQEGN